MLERKIEIDIDGLNWGTGTFNYEYDRYNRLAREIYPNQRAIEFAYDGAGRLSTVKGPFGFVNRVSYDDDEEGRVDALYHSALGMAELDYEPSAAVPTQDRLARLTLGNDATTDYLYDGRDRLTGFDIRSAADAQLLRHQWGHDVLGRKTDLDVVSPYFSDTTLDLTYDARSQLTRERLLDGGGGSGAWDVQYGYDDAGNRTALDDGTLDKTLSYGAGNRETAVSGGSTPLVYDFKGNVASRTPLGGGAAYTYTWDAWNRLTSVARSGQPTVAYTYDAQGRMIRRDEGAAQEDTRITYWVGLNKIAEERWGIDDVNPNFSARPLLDKTVAEPDSGAVDGWGTFEDPDTLRWAEDPVRGQVLHMTTRGDGATDGVFVRGDASAGADLNPHGNAFSDTRRKHLGLWLNNADGRPIEIVIDMWAFVGASQLVAHTENGTNYNAGGGCYHIYLGSGLNDGQWHYVEIDIADEVQSLSGGTVSTIYGVIFRAADLYVDDPILSTGRLETTYALMPGAALGGYLGAKKGPEFGGASWYYHYNDLGTVMATTNHNGSMLGVYEPDHFGNYRATVGSRPDTMGLTSKFHDPATGLYYFNARWYDPERGRFTSITPYRFDVEHPYGMADNSPVLYVDPTGEMFLSTYAVVSAVIGCGLTGYQVFIVANCFRRCLNALDDMDDNPNIDCEVKRRIRREGCPECNELLMVMPGDIQAGLWICVTSAVANRL